MATGSTRLNYEHKFQLLSQLEKLPSHFNQQIEKDLNRLSFVYNEILFKMDTLPSFFKPVLLNLIGFIECAKGNGAKGAKCFSNVKKIDERNIICLANRAYLALKRNNYTVVEQIIEEIYRHRDPDSSSTIHAEMGHFYQWFGLSCAARREYERALTLDTGNMIATYGLAVVLYEMSKHEGRVSGFRYLTRSMDLFKKVLIACPGFTLAKIYEGKARNQLISIVMPGSCCDDEADRIFTQVMGTDCAPEILCMIGEEYLRQGVLDGEPSAISIFERALEKRKNSKVYHLLALAMRATYFRANPEMHEVFKQGLFMKNKTDKNSEKQPEPKEKSKRKPAAPKPREVTETDPLVEDDATESATETIQREPPNPVTLEQVIETLSTAVKLSKGANREAVFDLAESLWLAGERMRAVTNFELATHSENTIIQLKAHLRLAQAFLDTLDLKLAEYHLKQVMKLELPQDPENSQREHFTSLLRTIALTFMRNNQPESAANWVNASGKYESLHTPFLKQAMVYNRTLMRSG